MNYDMSIVGSADEFSKWTEENDIIVKMPLEILHRKFVSSFALISYRPTFKKDLVVLT